MNRVVIPFLVGFTAFSPISFTLAQIAEGTPTATEVAQSMSTTAQGATSKEGQERKSKDAVASQATDQTWNSQVWFPLIRLFGIAAIIGLLLWFIDLPKFMDRQAWTDRTIVALILVFSFAASTMINVDDKSLTALKDVTLIVVGFYFGAAKVERQKETDGAEQTKNPEKPKT